MDDIERFNAVLHMANHALHSNSRGMLELPYRKSIWAAMGIRDCDIPPQQNIGLRRRTRLGVLAVNHVMRWWDEAFPNDAFPHDMLASIGRYWQGDLTIKAMNTFFAAGWTKVDNLNAEYPDEIAVDVAYGAIRAAMVAVGDEAFDSDQLDMNETDESHDPEELDTSCFVAGVYAGDPFKTDPITIGRRREFWQWYITKASIDAWHV